MSTSNPPSDTVEPGQQDPAGPSVPLLDYGCTPWRISSQRVADLYDSGTKFWTKSDLVDIERQLEQSATLDRFTIQCIDGKQVQVKNPLFGAEKPIWKPFVEYQEYWKLVASKPDGSSETYYCSYLVGWRNQLMRDFCGNIEDWTRLFETKRQLWNRSITCESFKSRLRKLLAARKVTKIVCFGLGDMARRPPEVTILPNQAAKQLDLESHGADVHAEMIQHAAALTMAEEIYRHDGKAIRLLAQDPQYTDDTKEFLREKGFEIVGNFGAGGFAEVDDESIVFSAWVAAPVKQIVADLARPAAFITMGDDRPPFNSFNKPFADGESPRTRQMWQGYEHWDFPTSSVEVEVMKGLDKLKIFTRARGEDAVRASSG
ncbi:hypothetical protein B0J15DRAFT_527559 [Fusarium solani]|uniref:SRR1-like domain-containing protein n=1 Tax=Fusarium solani TaxID=169388 RepID=A0A9P9K561_FUSSL|nr:uncharacterized protein B0J15DRAFT_527559 [Fusarium solani]KAH7248383.1 hypothetical protein B0J15DRAFT_527559 [Fusarium solani]